jgi:hypothetical protein
MKSIEVLQTLSEGDGGYLPAEAKVADLSIPNCFRPGLYRLKNVTLSSNGAMQVNATSKTAWEPVTE